MTGKAIVIRGNALHLPLPDESVDLLITSPPYFALRSYRDSGEHYTGQIGSEAHPQEWLEALWACMSEWWRVLKPSGSVFVNLGDKRTGSGGHNNSTLSSNWSNAPLQGGKRTLAALDADEAEGDSYRATRRNAPDRYNQAAFGRPKSKMLLPHRFAIGCEDGLADPEGFGWIVRQDLVWQKLNGLPESVQDRMRDSHEFIFHLTKQERYFAAMDEIRGAYRDADYLARGHQQNVNQTQSVQLTKGYDMTEQMTPNPLGKLPGSVWPMASEPLIIPAWAREKFNLPDHFACVDEDTEILTQRGWKRHDQLEAGEEVAGYDLDTGLARWTVCKAVHAFPFDGELVAVEKRDLSMRLTPTHRCLAAKAQWPTNTPGPLGIVLADELVPRHYIPRSAEWECCGPWEKSIGVDLAALCGWVAAEGYYQNDLVRLSQSLAHNPEKVAAIDALLGRFPFQLAQRAGRKTYRPTLGFLERKEQPRIYRGEDWIEVVWRLPLWLGHEVQTLMPDKLLGPWALELPEDERRALLEAFIDGDGHRRPDGRMGIYQKERQNLDILQAVAVTLGYKTTLRQQPDKWVLYLTNGRRPITLRGTNGSGKPIPREHYKGIVWCPTTGTGTFIARRNGSVFITGNSFPSELPRKLILGFSPSGICLECGQGRRPVVDRQISRLRGRPGGHAVHGSSERPPSSTLSEIAGYEATIIGYACACTPYTDHKGSGKDNNQPERAAERVNGYDWEAWKEGPKGKWREYHLDRWTPPPTRPAVILDPFGGTGTVAMVAKQLGRIGISVDLSADYSRLAQWRIAHPPSKVMARTWQERQGSLL